MKKAFTLAEVLITLTIIGIIAALTIPNLMQSYKKHQAEVGVKEAYSILSTAIKMAQIEYGTELTENNSDGYLIKRLMPYLKYDKMCMCDARKDSRYKDCPNLSGIPNNNGSLYNGFNNMHTWWYDRMLLKNGMLLFMEGHGDFITIVVDINGTKGPNKPGADVFSFGYMRNLSANQSINLPETLGRLVPGRNDHYNWPYWGKVNNIPCSASGDKARDYSGCSAVIMRNGWKIPNDYPVKKF